MLLTFLLACADEPEPAPSPESTVAPAPVEEPEEEPAAPADNRPPQIDDITLEPAAVDITTPIKAEVKASDPEGLPVDLDYTWMVNGQELLAVRTERLDNRKFKRGDKVALKVTASDGEKTVERATQIVVGNAPPRFTSDPRSINQIDGFRVLVEDPDGDPVKFRLEGAPAGMSIHPRQGVLSYQGSADEPGGQYKIQVIAEDEAGASATWEFQVGISAGSGAKKKEEAAKAGGER